MSSGPKSLRKLIGGAIDALGIRDKFDEARILETWIALAPESIQKRTDKTWVKDGTLYVRINSAIWRHELHLQRNTWLDRLNECLGSSLVCEIIFC